MKAAFWKSDRFVGLIISLVFFIAWWGANPALEGLEGDAYDLGVRMSSREDARRKDDIAVIAIDDQSIQNIGRWPWPRDVHANMVEKLSEAGTRAVSLAATTDITITSQDFNCEGFTRKVCFFEFTTGAAPAAAAPGN